MIRDLLIQAAVAVLVGTGGALFVGYIMLPRWLNQAVDAYYANRKD